MGGWEAYVFGLHWGWVLQVKLLVEALAALHQQTHHCISHNVNGHRIHFHLNGGKFADRNATLQEIKQKPLVPRLARIRISLKGQWRDYGGMLPECQEPGGWKCKSAPAGNRTRGGSVGGYHVTTTPLALDDSLVQIFV